MTNALIWLSPFFYLLLPAAAATGLGLRYRAMRRAAHLGLVHPAALRRLRWALVLYGVFLVLTLSGAYLEMTWWLPTLTALSAASMALLMRAARAGVHPGLRGFSWPLPRDGLELAERQQWARLRPLRLRRWRWRLAPVAPLLGLTVLLAGVEPRRWLFWMLLGVIALGPVLLMPYRNAWLAPMALLPVSGFFIWNGIQLKAQLPPGLWVTVWPVAGCSAPVAPVGDGTGWCVDARHGSAYHHHLMTGVVLALYSGMDAHNVFATSPTGAWIRQRYDDTRRGPCPEELSYPSGVESHDVLAQTPTGEWVRARLDEGCGPKADLVYLNLSTGQSQEFEVDFPIDGTTTSNGDLWVLDGSARLLVHTESTSSDQLLLQEHLTDIVPHTVGWGSLGLGGGRRRRSTFRSEIRRVARLHKRSRAHQAGVRPCNWPGWHRLALARLRYHDQSRMGGERDPTRRNLTTRQLASADRFGRPVHPRPNRGRWPRAAVVHSAANQAHCQYFTKPCSIRPA